MSRSEFDKWFTGYCLHKTASCLDRDILRWAKPILEYGFNLQEKDEDALEFKGANMFLDKIQEQKFKIIELENRLKELT